jgi:glutamate racemase
MGPKVRLINPAYNTVLDLKKILEGKNLLKLGENRKENYYTSGNPNNMERIAKKILGSFEGRVEKVRF